MNNGYTKLEVSGHTVGIRWGLPARDWLMEKVAEMPDLIFNKKNMLTSVGMAYVLFFGYRNECIYQELTPVLKAADFIDYIEHATYDPAANKAVAEAIEVWATSMHVRKLVENAIPADVKKKNGSPTKLKHTVTVASE